MEKVRQWPGLDIYQSWAQGKNNSAKPSSNPQRSQEEPDLKLGQGGIRYQSLFRRLLRQHVPLSPSFLASSLYCGWEIDWYNREILENPKPTQRILCQNRSSGLPLVHLCLTDRPLPKPGIEPDFRPINLLFSYRTHKDSSLEATFQNNRAIAALFQSISLRMPIPLSSFFRLKEFIPAYRMHIGFWSSGPDQIQSQSSFSIFFKDDLGSAKELWYEVWKRPVLPSKVISKSWNRLLIFSKS